jgi:hypothetical protein
VPRHPQPRMIKILKPSIDNNQLLSTTFVFFYIYQRRQFLTMNAAFSVPRIFPSVMLFSTEKSRANHTRLNIKKLFKLKNQQLQCWGLQSEQSHAAQLLSTHKLVQKLKRFLIEWQNVVLWNACDNNWICTAKGPLSLVNC